MEAEKAKKLILIFRQIREVVKTAIDDLEAIAENTLMIFVDDQSDRIAMPSSVAIENRLLNKKEIAERLGVSVRTVSDLQTEGLPTVKLGKRVLFDYQDVLVWAKGKEIKSRRKNNLHVVR
jgi:excisionase family DNA binding protein